MQRSINLRNRGNCAIIKRVSPFGEELSFVIYFEQNSKSEEKGRLARITNVL